MPGLLRYAGHIAASAGFMCGVLWSKLTCPVICTPCAQPQDAYGLEKLATEELCKHYGKDFGIETRIARFHNIYGPHGTWKGGREKAPAAFCRKVNREKCQAWERAHRSADKC